MSEPCADWALHAVASPLEPGYLGVASRPRPGRDSVLLTATGDCDTLAVHPTPEAALAALEELIQTLQSLSEALPTPQPSGPAAPSPSQEMPMTEVFTAITLDRLITLLDGDGLVARREGEGDHAHLVFNLASFKVLLLPYGEGEEATSLQLHAGFQAKPGSGAINAWNRENRFGRAFLDEEGDAILQYDLDLEGGATGATVLEAVRTFRLLLEAFASTVFED